MSDDFEFDDLDMDGLDGDPFAGELDSDDGSRNPVTAARNSFVEGVKDDLLTKDAAMIVARKGLPEGYSAAIDAVDEVAGEVDDLYNKAEKKLEPAVKTVKEVTSKVLPKAEGILPKAVYEKLAEFTESSGGSSFNQDAADNETISNSISQIFETQMEQNAEQTAQATVQKTMENQQRKAEHKQSMGRMAGLQNAMERLVSYQDSITSNYQKKSLELQFRHYFAARDLLKVQQASNTDILNALNAIMKNTGLPDWVKSESNEDFREQLQQRLMGDTVETLGDYASNFKQRLFGNIKTKVLDGVGQVADAVEGFGGLANTMLDMQEMEGGEGGSTASMAAGFAGQMGGGWIADKLITAGAKALQNESSRSGKVMRHGLQLQNWAKQLPQDFLERVEKADDQQGLGGSLLRWFQDVIPERKVDERVLHNLYKDGTQEVPWDVLSRRTLVEIIPELLSRINQNTEMLVTGKPAEKMVYSKQQEGFVRESEAIAQTAKTVLDRGAIKEYRSNMDKFIEALFKGSDVSDEAKLVMAEQLRIDSSRNWAYKPERYFDAAGFEAYHDPNAVGELVLFFKKKYGAQADGDGWTWKQTEANLKDVGRLNRHQDDLIKTQPNMQEAINRVVANGDKALLRETGWINNESGKDEFNKQRLEDLLSGRLSLDDLEGEAEVKRLSERQKAAKNQWERTRPSEEAAVPAAPVMEETLNSNPVQLTSGTFDVEPDSVIANLLRDIRTAADLSLVEQDGISRALSDALASADISVTAKTDERLLLAIERVEQEFKTHPEVFDKQLDALHEIRDLIIAQTQVQASSADAELGKELLAKFTALSNWEQPKWYDSLSSGLVDGIKGGAGLLGGYYKGLWNLGSTAVDKATGLGKDAWKFVSGATDQVDVFLAGRATPVLQANLMATGRYVDEATGKVVNSLADITGAVKDISTGQYVITAEDFERGLFTGDGTSILSKVGQGAKNLATGAIDALGSYYGMFGKAFDWAKKKVVQWDADLKNHTDVWIASRMQDGPVLLRTVLKRGGYFDINGNPIFNVGDIEGPVFDEQGNCLINDEDLHAGLVDKDGKKVEATGILKTGLGLGAMGLNLAAKLGKASWTALKGYYGGLKDVGANFMERIGGAFDFGLGSIENMNVEAKTVNLYVGKDRVVYGEQVKAEQAEEERSAAEEVKVTPNAEQAEETVTESPTKPEPEPTAKPKPDFIKEAQEKLGGVGKEMERFSQEVRERAQELTDSFDKERGEKENTVVAALDRVAERITGTFTDKMDEQIAQGDRFAKLDKEARDKMARYYEEGVLNSKVKDQEIDDNSNIETDSSGRTWLTIGREKLSLGDGSQASLTAAMTGLIAKMSGAGLRGDNDGDGYRDGSWRDQLFGENFDEDGNQLSIADNAKNMAKDKLGRLGGLLGLGGMFGSDDEEGGDDDSFLQDVAEEALGEKAADMLGGGDDDGKKDRRSRSKKPRPGKKGGKISRLIDWGKDKFSSGGKEVREKGFKKSIGDVWNKGIKGGASKLFNGIKAAPGKIMSGIAGAGSLGMKGLRAGGAATGFLARTGFKAAAGLAAGALGVLASPWVGAALTAWTVGEAGYHAFKFMSRRSSVEPLEQYRFLQYGIDPENSDQVVQIRYLEDQVEDYVERGNGGVSTFNFDVNPAEEWAEDFGVDLDNGEQVNQWMQWFTNRFTAVYLLHHQTLAHLDKSADLDDIDDDLDKDWEKKLSFVKNAYFKLPEGGWGGKTPYQLTYQPFPEYPINVGYDDIDAFRKSLIEKFEGELKKGEGETKQPITTMAGAAMGTAMAAAHAAKKLDGRVVESKFKAGNESSVNLSEERKAAGTKMAAAVTAAYAGVEVASRIKPRTTEKAPEANKELFTLRMLSYSEPKTNGVAVRRIRALEKAIAKDIYKRGDSVIWIGTPEALWRDFAVQFGWAVDNDEGKERWTHWLTNVVVPVAIATAGVYYTFGGNGLDDTTRLDDIGRWEVAQAIIGTDVSEYYSGIGQYPGNWTVNHSENINVIVGRLVEAAERLERNREGIVLPSDRVAQPQVNAGQEKRTEVADKATDAANPKPNLEETVKNPTANKPAVHFGGTEVKPKTASKLGDYQIPVDVPNDGRVSSPYGMRVHPVNGGRKLHSGIDIAAPTGTPVMAAQDAVITKRYKSESYGNVIFAKNADGTEARYAHMHSFTPGLSVGDSIEKGQQIGTVGSTGWSTGPHLHFEVRKNPNDKNSAIDPMKLFQSGDQSKVTKQIKETVEKVEEAQKPPKPEDNIEGVDTIASTEGKVKPVPTDVFAIKKAPEKSESVPNVAETVPSTPAPKSPFEDYFAPTTFTEQKPKPDLTQVDPQLVASKRLAENQQAATQASVTQMNALHKATIEGNETRLRMEKLLQQLVDNVTGLTPTKKEEKQEAPAKPVNPLSVMSGKQLAGLKSKPTTQYPLDMKMSG